MAQNARQVLVYVLTDTLKLLHPFMPFVTEEIWQSLPHDGEALIVAPWPQYEEGHAFPQAEAEMKKVMELITRCAHPPQRNERAPLQEGPPVYRDRRYRRL